jgi:endonuclease-8
VPEGDTIFRAARTLNRALAGQIITKFETVLPHLERVHEDAPIIGRTVESATSSGKWLQINFSGGLILLTHMLMSGSWHIYRPGEAWLRPRADMRIVLETATIVAVVFNVPIAEFHTEESLKRRPGFNRLGEDVLSVGFDEAAAVQSIRSRPDVEVGNALIDQSSIAGLGNVFKSEVCFGARVNPFRGVESLNDAELRSLISFARKYAAANVTDNSGDGIVTYAGFRRTTRRANPAQRLWVYKRAGEPCRRCGTSIQVRKQGPRARVTFWCPQCQPLTA